jgi:hypothetical protein
MAIVFVNISTPAFAALYGPRPATGLEARIEEKLMIVPPVSFKYLMAACEVKKTLVRLN